MEKFKKFLGIAGIVIGILVVLGIVGATICVRSIDKHEYGYTFNRFTGEIDSVGRTGWIVVNPFKYSLHKIDLRPYQLKITADLDLGERVLNAKLCRFNPKGLETFIQWHGRSAGDDVNKLKEILKCYAFAPDGGKSCPFLTVDAEIEPKQSPSGINQTQQINEKSDSIPNQLEK